MSSEPSYDRPIYEQAQNRADESLVVARVRDCWPGVGLVGLPYDQMLDYDCYDAERRYLGCLEIKRRYWTLDRWPDFLLSERKFLAGTQRTKRYGGSLIIIAAFDDATVWYRYDPRHLWAGLICREQAGGRTYLRRDRFDVEPVWHVPFRLFQHLRPE